MGYDSSFSGFALAGDEAEAGVAPVQGWVGLARAGTILLSVEEIGAGLDANQVLAHETVHDVLLHTTAHGLAMLSLAPFTVSLIPPGVVSVTGRRVQSALAAAANVTQEACATMVVATQLSSELQASYWAGLPISYVKAVEPFRWLLNRSLEPKQREAVIMAAGRYALGIRVDVTHLVRPTECRRLLNEPKNNPDRRFQRALGLLEQLDVSELLRITDRGEAEIAERLARLDAPFGYWKEVPSYPVWVEAWIDRFWELIVEWASNPRVTPTELDAMPKSREECLLMLPVQVPTVAKASLTKTGSARMSLLDSVTARDVNVSPLTFLRFSNGTAPVPAFDNVDAVDRQSLLAGQCSFWFHNPSATEASGLITDTEGGLRCLEMLPAASTVVVDDVDYLPEFGDVIGERSLLRGRRHLLHVEHSSPGAFLRGPVFGMGLAGHHDITMGIWQGSTEGISYILVRPTSASHPMIVIPTTTPTAHHIWDHPNWYLEQFDYTLVTGEKFLPASQVLERVDLTRFCMWFEDHPWPEQYKTFGLQRARAWPVDLELGIPPDSSRCGGDPVDRLPRRAKRMLDRVRRIESSGAGIVAAKEYERERHKGDDVNRSVAGLALGDWFAEQGFWDAAEETFSQVARESVNGDLRAEALMNRAGVLRVTSRTDEAILDYLAIIQTKNAEHAPRAAANLARLLTDIDPEQARLLFEWARRSKHPDVVEKVSQDLRILNQGL